jgi:pSer/pThr/pTyr-binding forkhead associated (FHA) protein
MDIQVNGELIPQGGGDNIPLTRSPLVVGRRESSDICLQFPNISGKHCELIFKDGIWVMRDLESTNGVKVNGVRMDSGTKKVLHTGDVLTIGKRVYTLQYVQTGRPSDLEEYEQEIENAMNIPLLEKAGLANPPRRSRAEQNPPPGAE